MNSRKLSNQISLFEKKKRPLETFLYALIYLSGIFTVLVLASIIGYVAYKGIGAINWTFFSTIPSMAKGTFGILSNLINTVYLIVLTLLISLPVGIGAAVYLNEYAKHKKFVALIEYATETLSGIPSIIYGLVGMLFFCQFLNLQTSLLAGALTLVIMNLPTIMRTTQESLKTVPQSYREGAFGLGAGKWRVIRTVVLPGCIDGVLTGCILSVGRILGESAALLFTAGFAHALNGFFSGLVSSGATLTVALYVYAKEQGEFEVAFAIAAILMIMALLINLSASLVSKAFRNKDRPKGARDTGAGKIRILSFFQNRRAACKTAAEKDVQGIKRRLSEL